MKNVLEYLEESCFRHPDKTAVIDEKESCTYRELLTDAKLIGTLLAGRTGIRRPVAVFMDKSAAALKVFMGILYAGCFYTLIEPSFPTGRVGQILGILQNNITITVKGNEQKLHDAGYSGEILYAEELTGAAGGGLIDEAELVRIRRSLIDTDPVYCNFTSGSTGVPKGVLICHRSVIDFIDCFTEIFDITEDDVIGNQAPFDFDVSVKDIYSSLKMGAALVIIPKAYFMFPNSVIDMLETYGVTTLVWAVSALCLLNRLHGLKYKAPSKINKILFSGEVMPIKQLAAWQEYYPNAMFVNLYGPTEITCNCTYYIVDRKFSDTDRLPIGCAFPNERVFLLDENDREITADRQRVSGELCVAGSALALGYYNNPDMTARAFTGNPLQPAFFETIYRTGDLAYWDSEGMLCFAGRKDFQIKHMGHRIELEEIESVLGGVGSVEQACCFFDEEKGKVVAFYVGGSDKKQMIREMKSRVPEYMVPNIFRQVESLPITKNGKTDRRLLKELYLHETDKRR